MRENNLTVKPNTRLIAKRVSERPKPRADKPKQYWGIDMTKVISKTGWVYVVVVLDWYTKKIVAFFLYIVLRQFCKQIIYMKRFLNTMHEILSI